MRSILVSSIACLFAAAFPLILATLDLSDSAIWRLSSGGFLAASTGLSVYMAINRRKLPAGVRGTVFARLAWFLATIVMLSLAANVVGWPLPPSAGVHLLSVWLFLGISAVNFLDLVFRGVLGGART